MAERLRRFLIVLTCALALCGCKEKAGDVAPKALKKEFCEGTLLVHLGKHALLVPRTKQETSLKIYLEDGTELYGLHRPQPGYGCDVNEIQNAVRVSWSRYEVSVIKEGYDYNGFKGTYGNIEARYLAAKKEKRVARLEGGLEVINPEKVIYVLPEHEFPTLKGYPVAFGCDQFKGRSVRPILGGCTTQYADPRGLYVRYSFTFNDNDPDDALEVEKERREFLRSMLVLGLAELRNRNFIGGK